MSLVVAVTGQVLVHEPVAASDVALRDFLSADATLANLEATVETPGAWPTKTKTLHLAAPEAVAALPGLGFSALAHANNHAFDLGPPGIARTRTAVEAAGMALAGSGETLAAAAAPARLETPAGPLALFAVDLGPQPDIVYAAPSRAGIAGLRMRRAVTVPPAEYDLLRGLAARLGDEAREAARAAVGYRAAGPASGFELFGTEIRPGTAVAAHWRADAGDRARLTAGLAAEKAAGRHVAVALHNHHWDPDWRRSPAWLVDLARCLIDAGADIVFGTGAPVLQGVAFHRGRVILGGLGNFIFHTGRPGTYDETGVDVWRSLAARVTLAPDGTCRRLDLLPVAVARPPETGRPAPAPAPLRGPGADEIFARAVSGLDGEDRARVARA